MTFFIPGQLFHHFCILTLEYIAGFLEGVDGYVEQRNLISQAL
jgi:hypothetical protein